MNMTLSIFLFVCFVFFLSCNENPDNDVPMKQVTSSSKVDTIIFSVDTLQFNFGGFGAYEELSVIIQPSHAKLFTISTEQTDDRIMHYAPQDEFLGIDSVIILSKRIAEETEPFIKIDSVLLVIRTVKNEIHKNIIGKWILTWVCGGFTGQCNPMDSAKAPHIEFGYNMDFTESDAGTIVKSLKYYLKDSVYYYGTQSVTRHMIFVNDAFEGKKYKREIEYSTETGNLVEWKGQITNTYFRVKE